LAYKTLQFQLENHVGVLTINRPEALNALNAELVEELGRLLLELKGNSDLRVLIVTGAGEKAFVAGADIKEMDARPADSGTEMARKGQAVFRQLEELHCPVIAAVNGFALGGGLELALACDFIVASNKAKLGLPEVSLGLIPGYGGTQRLSRSVGKATARLMTLTGDIYSAEQCEKWGLVSLLTEPADLMPTCQKIAQTIASRSPKALALAKKAINQGFDHTEGAGLNLEAELFGEVFKSEDKKIGVKAFIGKEKPQFVGR
jgi:enoyl-CoA hydratase